MRLANAASYFDHTPCQDAFNPATVIYGQLDLFDDSRRDGATVVRRILSVKPGTLIPARRVLTVHGEPWIVGGHEVDSFGGSVIRDKHVLHRGEACTVQTIAQALTTGGTATYGGKLWVKDFKEQEVSSKLEGFFNIYLPSSEALVEGNVIALAGRVHLVRNSFPSVAGFLVAEVNELPAGAIVSASYVARTLDPVADSLSSGTPVTLNVLQMRYQDHYAYSTEAAEKYALGDVSAFVAKTDVASAKINDKVTIAGTDWIVLAVADASNAWELHVRRAGT
jgi:hypothetical protein